MSYLRRFSPDDIFINRMETNPQYSITLYSGSAYINNRRHQGVNIPTGSVSLFEMNVNRDGINQLKIYPFQVKDGTNKSFRGIATSDFRSSSYGTQLRGRYPLTSSIVRDYIQAGKLAETYDDNNNPTDGNLSPQTYFTRRKKIIALQNTLNNYKTMSPSYGYEGRNLTGAISLVSIPGIIYGEKIKKGTVSLKVYYTGTLLDEAKDHRKNGELVSTKGITSGAVVGVVLYNEGFILLNRETSVSNTLNTYDNYEGTGVIKRFNWTYWGAYSSGSIKGSSYTDTSASLFTLDFEGTQKIPNMTMFAHAPAGEVNNSQNLTWVSSSYKNWQTTSFYNTASFYEPSDIPIKNTVYSQYCDFEEDFEKQVFISEVGIYDKNKNLLGVAKLANPVLKKDTDSFTFKLKLDM
jgi:hypothetical protein